MKIRTVLQIALALLAGAAAAPAAVLRPALDTTIKGANGTEVKFTIVGVWADGFHAKQGGTKPPLFIAWEKVDTAWLEAERPEIQKLKATAKPFPALSPEEAAAKLEAAKKLFRAPKTITYDVSINETRSVPNVMAEKYAARVRGLTPSNLTQALNQISVDVQRDAANLKDTNSPADRLQRNWLTGPFVAFLGKMEKTQRELDPLAAGDVVMPKIEDPFRGVVKNDEWF